MNVTATFSEAMAVSSINGTTFKLIEKGSTRKARRRHQLRFGHPCGDPGPDLLRTGITYKAVVTAGAKDLVGNWFEQNGTKTGAQPKTWLFTVSN